MDGAYVVTPAYQGFMNGYAEGLHSWDNLMPEGFKNSQMFASYYQPSGIEDLAYFFINFDNLGCIQFCLGRHLPTKKFSKNELTLLEAISRFIISLIRKNWEVVLNQAKKELLSLSSIVSERVDYLLNNFEPTLLTARERDIAKLVITGHSSQSAADKLNISPGTERVHRAKLYAKLNLRSSSELFSYFLQQLTSI
jgi:DNA-binding CsgD family transcriptional regulator